MKTVTLLATAAVSLAFVAAAEAQQRPPVRQLGAVTTIKRNVHEDLFLERRSTIEPPPAKIQRLRLR